MTIADIGTVLALVMAAVAALAGVLRGTGVVRQLTPFRSFDRDLEEQRQRIDAIERAAAMERFAGEITDRIPPVDLMSGQLVAYPSAEADTYRSAKCPHCGGSL